MSIDILDNLWLLLATFLVFLMQAGFLLLEGGRVRAKNSINVAQKNLCDLLFACAGFLCVGFFLMYGVATPLLHDTTMQQLSPLQVLFQMGFCATAASIISGGVAERMTFRAYLGLVLAVSCLIYPLVGRMVWGNQFLPDTIAPLAQLGFMDYAGSTVIHGVGAWAALTAIILIGPRIGRFDEQARPQPIPAHNSVISTLGILLLLFGWIGFNGGAISIADPRLPTVLFSTIVAGIFGALGGLVIGARLDKGIFNPGRCCNGMLGGLVACTASADAISTPAAAIVGLLGGALATAGAECLLRRCKIDDPVDVVATHGFAGVFGTLAVAFVVPAESLIRSSRLEQFLVQLFGVASVAAAVMAATWLSLKLIAQRTPLRVSAEDEELGLNYTEHGEAVGTTRLKQALQQAGNSQRTVSRLQVSSDDEHSDIAAAMNALLDKHDEAHVQIQLSEQRFRQFAQTASDWLWETDTLLRLTFISDNAGQLSAVFDGIGGTPFFDFFSLKENDELLVKRCMAARSACDVFEGSVSIAPPGQKSRTLEIELRAVPYYNQIGEFAGYRGTMSDITPRKAAQNRALYLAMHDDLTGLPNRRALAERLPDMLKKAASADLAVLLAAVDLDGFKQINDRYGHPAGDELLKQVGARLNDLRRPEDSIYRTGGDEFVLVLGSLDPDRAMQTGETINKRVIAALSGEFYLGVCNAKIGASIGVALFPEHTESANDLTHMADLALYEAKRRGKNCIAEFEPQLDTDARQRAEIEYELRDALAQDQLYLMYQPMHDLDTENLNGFEALLRWKHPRLGDISPAVFIPIAEQIGIIDEIGEFSLRTACQFACDWQTPKHGWQARIAVNVSPLQLRQTGFTELVKEVLASTGLAATRLELELTEEVLIQDFSTVSTMLQELFDMGITIAVDDFGSGQTSLRYLKQFPISKLKIDRSFVSHIDHDSKASEIARLVVQLGHNLGASVIAEGVETQQHLEMLRHWQCDEVQGYLFAKPMTEQDVHSVIAMHNEIEPQRRAG